MTVLSAIQLNALPANSPNQHDIPVPAGELVLLKEEGFDLSTTAAIEVSARSNGMSPLNVLLYKGSCDFKYQTVSTLPSVPRDLLPLDNVRLAFNYNYGDLPIYAAGKNSTLNYSISASYKNAPAQSQRTGCALELFLFDDETKYNRFIENPFLQADGFVDHSGCLLELKRTNSTNVIKNTTTAVFTLKTANAYFVSIDTMSGLETHTNISASVFEFSDSGLDMVNCALNEYVTKCKVSFDDRNSRSLFQLPACNSNPVCVWAKAESYALLSLSTPDRVIYSYTITGSVVGGVLLCVLCVINCCLVRCMDGFYEKSASSLLQTASKVVPCHVQNTSACSEIYYRSRACQV